jgi:alkylhydroperoxidase family enzyme
MIGLPVLEPLTRWPIFGFAMLYFFQLTFTLSGSFVESRVVMPARISPAAQPFHVDVASQIDRTMKGRPPLVLFATLARDPRLCAKFFAGGLLDRGHLTIRQREIVILRTTARCGSEYEWGVHVATFGARADLTEAEMRSTVRGGPDDACWSAEEALLVRFCDALHAACDVDDALWAALSTQFTDEAMLELLLLAGFYRTVSYLTNATRLPLEDGAARFPR